MYTKRREKIRSLLADVDLECNKNQFGCTVAAICDPKRKRTLLAIPSGKGKSRVIAAIIALKSDFSVTKHFTIVYSSELLKNVDEEKISLLSRMLGKNVTIQQVTFNSKKPLFEQVLPNSFVLIDEADTILLDHTATLRNKQVVGLSATAINKNLKIESEFLERSNFRYINSKISGFIDCETGATPTSVRQFINDSRGFAKLVFATGSAKQRFLEECNADVSEIDCMSLPRLQKLTANDLLLVTDPSLMRGVDYRVLDGNKGIHLLIMSSFDSTRSYIQALGRVGRYHEQC